MKLRDYQIELSNKGAQILSDLKIVYFVMQVRTGKTLTALNTANLYGAKKVLFITKLKAISSIQEDYNALNPDFEIQIINKESLHKVTDNDFDLLIVDENHAVSSSFPKPNQAAKMIKERFGSLPQIYLSGTPAIESGSQWYHSFWISNYSPFKEFKNFYGWTKVYTEPSIKHFGAIKVNDYSKAKTEQIMPKIEPYLIRYTQEDAGFSTTITETVLHHPVNEKTKGIVKRLLRDLVVVGAEEKIMGDSPAKLMSKIHQIENGTIIFESGNAKIMDHSKAEFIRDYFKGKKMGIFYYFKKEYELLKDVFGDDLTNDLDVFNSTDKHIALQQVSGSEGLSLKNADVLVFYNTGYSGKLYTQGRDRLTTMERKSNEIFFVFDESGINARIYESLINKKKYNEKTFQKDYQREINPNINPQLVKKRGMVRNQTQRHVNIGNT